MSAELTRSVNALTEMLAIDFLDRQTRCGAVAYCSEPATMVLEGVSSIPGYRIPCCDAHRAVCDGFVSNAGFTGDPPVAPKYTKLPNVYRVQALLKGSKWGQ
jgi:hypothetical protein